MEVFEQLISELVSINSINPDLVTDAPGEAEIARFITHWLERNGVEVHVIETVSGRPNVVGICHGTGGGRTLLLNGHMDTVGAGRMAHPHEPVIKEGRLYGRGAYDMKGGLAACMVAIAEARKLHLRGDVIFTAVVDEENASLGTQELIKSLHADGAIVAEFTELRLILAHRGFVIFEVETLGQAAHGSRPDLGTDAIAKMGKFLVELEKLDRALRSHPTHPLLGSGSLHASIIHGGNEVSTYPDRCVLTMERRTIPGESPEKVEGEFVEIIDKIQQSDASFRAVIQRGFDRSPLETAEEAGIVKAVQAAASIVLNHPLPVAGVQFWSDAALLSVAGIPSVLLGPSGSGAHGDDEWVDLSSVRTCANIYLATAKEFCG
jgi:acetylornithine deacetylase/succinyl-diaminopimelate desuccinylase family protein